MQVKYDYIGYYKSIAVDEQACFKKWRPVLEQQLGVNNIIFMKKISVFAEKCSIIEPIYASPPWHPASPLIDNKLPQILGTLRDEFNDFILNDPRTKLNIINEYYNTITGKRGLLLEHNIRIEDGKFLNPKHQQKIDKIICIFLDRKIECILSPEKQKFYEREDKINRILKGDLVK